MSDTEGVVIEVFGIQIHVPSKRQVEPRPGGMPDHVVYLLRCPPLEPDGEALPDGDWRVLVRRDPPG